MSDLSKIKDAVGALVERLSGHVPPEARPALEAAAANIHSAIGEVESAGLTAAESAVLPSLAAAAIKVVPPELAPLVPMIFKLGIDALTARASTPATA